MAINLAIPVSYKSHHIDGFLRTDTKKMNKVQTEKAFKTAKC